MHFSAIPWGSANLFLFFFIVKTLLFFFFANIWIDWALLFFLSYFPHSSTLHLIAVFRIESTNTKFRTSDWINIWVEQTWWNLFFLSLVFTNVITIWFFMPINGILSTYYIYSLICTTTIDEQTHSAKPIQFHLIKFSSVDSLFSPRIIFFFFVGVIIITWGAFYAWSPVNIFFIAFFVCAWRCICMYVCVFVFFSEFFSPLFL